jgi:hypothetical protein
MDEQAVKRGLQGEERMASQMMLLILKKLFIKKS